MNFANLLYENYSKYLESNIQQKRFKYDEFIKLIEKHKKNSIFTIVTQGKSVEGREIFLIKYGSGKRKVFLWSQMHGDEPTATMALFDIFNFLASQDFCDVKKNIAEQLTIYFMPNVNPDGAELFQRRNKLEIDLNRDAARLETPEAKILMSTYKSINADFGFNLHDQSSRYSVGSSFKQATISFLAPPYNYEKEYNHVRDNSVKVIVEMINTLNNFIPGHLAKYLDDFEPRAFGDNFQKLGMSTVLVESGGWKDDVEKQFVRKLNFVALLSALKSIAEKRFITNQILVYENLPFNEKYIYDLVLRNLTIKQGDKSFKADIAINLNEVNIEETDGSYFQSTIEDVGDLSIFFGLKDLDLEGYTVDYGKLFPKIFKSQKEINKIELENLYRAGYTTLKFKNNLIRDRYTRLGINLKTNNQKVIDEIKIGNRADLVIKKNDKTKFVIVNGFIYDVATRTGFILNGIIE